MERGRRASEGRGSQPGREGDEARRAAERLELVASALSRAATLEQAAKVALQQMRSALGARKGMIALREGTRIRVLSHEFASEDALRGYEEFALDAPVPAAEAVRSGRAVFICSPEELLATHPHLARAIEIGGRAWAAVPLLLDERAMGVATFSFAEPRTFSPRDEGVMMAIARQAAQAIARAQLLEAERSARARVEQVLELTRSIEAITRRVSRAVTAEDVGRAVTSAVREALDASFTGLYLLREPELELVAHDGTTEAFAQRYRRIARASHTPAAEALATGQTIFTESREEYEERYPEADGRLRAAGHDGPMATITTPLLVDDRVLGVLTCRFDDDRALDEDVLRFVTVVGDHSALALARSELFEAEHRARKEAEQAALRAADADLRKDEFLAMLGHELRNPLAPIATALQLAQLRGDGSSAREHQIIERQVQHLSRLVDDLLDVSRITRGKVELKRLPLALADVVGRAIDIASPLLEKKGHHVDVAVPRDLSLLADPLRLCQVIANLLTNAAKYTDPGGHIRVVGERSGERLVLSVHDDGMGIGGELLPHVFEMFRQAPQTIARSQGGLGLGLTLARQLTELHGGTIEAHSAGPGRGSTFRLTLPALTEPLEVRAATLRPALAFGPATEGARVLVVDDNEDGAELLAAALSAAGFKTFVAFDGPSALEEAARHRPDVVCLDIGLPVMDGFEVAEHLCAGDHRPRRLIAITGYGQESDRRRAFEAGFDVHLVKPVALDVLVAACRDEAPSAQ